MKVPPGPVYLTKNVHFFLLPAITVYLALKVGKECLNLSIPTWIVVATTLLARPALTFARIWCTDFKNKMEAASLSAVLVPHVPESFFTVAKKAVRGLDDFPGLPTSSKLCSLWLLTKIYLKAISWPNGQRNLDILSVFLDPQLVWWVQ